jgi:hypothetical protein
MDKIPRLTGPFTVMTDPSMSLMAGTELLVQKTSYLQIAASQNYPEIVDLQDLQQNNGFSRWQRYVCPDGSKSKASKHSG